MSEPTYQQLETLTDFLTQNPRIAKGILRTLKAKREAKIKWDEISMSLNALGGAHKDGNGWEKYWADKLYALKETCAELAQSMRRRGGQAAGVLPMLSPVDQRLVALMGGIEFATGMPEAAVNPFPSTIQDMQWKEEIGGHSLELPASPALNVETTRDRTQKDRRPVIVRSGRIQKARSRTRSRPDQYRELYKNIEKQRVEAEAVTAKSFSEAVQHMAALNTYLEAMSAAFRDSAQTIANALNNIADAIRSNNN